MINTQQKTCVMFWNEFFSRSVVPTDRTLPKVKLIRKGGQHKLTYNYRQSLVYRFMGDRCVYKFFSFNIWYRGL